jgi:RNA polymerase sigma factor (sigma-70 family)
MATAQLASVLRCIHRLAGASSVADHSDRQLLQRFVEHRDEDAFAALVRRHGPMVLGVCWRVLRQMQDAEDVFQATFLVLARRAASVAWREGVGNWLYEAAYRLALELRGRNVRRRERERQAEAMCSSPSPTETSGTELANILEEELHRLPERYRAPLLLCVFEGKTRDEAAGELGCSLRTVKHRLERGRSLLRQRLARRGLTLAVALLLHDAGRAALSAELIRSTARAASLFAAGKSFSTTVSPRASILAEDALTGMIAGKVKFVSIVVLALTLAASGAGLAVFRTPAHETPPKPAKERRAQTQPRVDAYGDPLPADDRARLGTIRLRQGHFIFALAFSPDGKRIASGGGDRLIRLWDATTGAPIRLFQGHENDVTALVFSADGKRLVSGGTDGTVRVWQAATGKEVRLLIRDAADDPCRFAALALSPDGKVLAAGNSQGSIVLHDMENFQSLPFTSVEPSEVRSLAFSPAGKRLVAGRWNGTVRVWDTSSGKEVAELKGHTQMISEVAFSPDGKTIATAANGDPDLRLWDAVTGKEVRRLPGKYGFDSVRFFPDGKSLLTGGYGPIRIWDVGTGKEVRRLDAAAHATLSPDGRRVAAAGQQSLRLWDAQTGEEIPYPRGHRDAVWSVALSPDRRIAATADSDPGIIHFWDLWTAKELRRCEGHVGMLGRIVFTPEGKGLVSTGVDGTARLWDVATGKEVRRFEGSSGIHATLALSPDGKLLVEAGLEGLRGWIVATGNSAPWPPAKGRLLRSAAFSPDGKLLATGGWNKEITLWDPSTGKEVRRLEGHTGSVYSVAFSPDGKTLASVCCMNRFVKGAGEDPTIRFWDVATGRESRRLEGPKGGAYELAFSADGRMLVSAGADGRIRLWETATGKERRSLAGHQGPVTAVALSRDGRIILSGSVDTTGLVWDITNPADEPGRDIAEKELASLWTDHESGYAARAFRAMSRLNRAPARSVPFIKERLKPILAPSENRIAQLLRDLESEQFAVREKATRELQQLGESAELALRRAIADKPTAELRKRVELLLETLDAGRLRPLRCVEMLEHLDTPEARELLRHLADGMPEAWLTRQAKASLARRSP